MNEEIVEEIYSRLVERFGIGDVFLPKHGKRKATITWKEFIKATLTLNAEKLYTYCGYNSSDTFSAQIKSIYPEIREDKKGKQWLIYFTSLIGKKRCSLCNLILNYNNFNSKITASTMLQDKCKGCEGKRNKEYYSDNKSEFKVRNAKRKATKINATPSWANHLNIKLIYDTCPPNYHVDHIIPLQHPLVCGLHCEFNLQHLPANENLSKGNKFEV